MAKVRFGMIWSVYGKQTIDLPDYINPDDGDAVKDYIETIWADIPLPEGEYIDNSVDLDEDGEIEIIKDIAIQRISMKDLLRAVSNAL